MVLRPLAFLVDFDNAYRQQNIIARLKKKENTYEGRTCIHESVTLKPFKWSKMPLSIMLPAFTNARAALDKCRVL